jgi:hypothetical protein
MRRLLAMLAVLLPLAAAVGCVGQPSRASQGIEVNPFNWGTGQQVVSPANDHNYLNGEPMDMRRR